jgi:hypothetical protein
MKKIKCQICLEDEDEDEVCPQVHLQDINIRTKEEMLSMCARSTWASRKDNMLKSCHPDGYHRYVKTWVEPMASVSWRIRWSGSSYIPSISVVFLHAHVSTCPIMSTHWIWDPHAHVSFSYRYIAIQILNHQ